MPKGSDSRQPHKVRPRARAQLRAVIGTVLQDAGYHALMSPKAVGPRGTSQGWAIYDVEDALAIMYHGGEGVEEMLQAYSQALQSAMSKVIGAGNAKKLLSLKATKDDDLLIVTLPTNLWHASKLHVHLARKKR